MSEILIPLLARQLSHAFDRRSWHGTNLWGALKRLRADEAAWRPQPGRHNIWELAVHAAYWKYRVFRLLTNAPPQSFELPGSDFFRRPDESGPSRWDADRELLSIWHQRLLGAVEGFDEARLAAPVGNDRFTYQELILGAAAHDLYHTGQIQLLKRLRTEAGSGTPGS